MLPDKAVERPATEAKGETVSDRVYAIGQTLAALEPGPLAELRRMSLDGAAFGAPYFWRLAARHNISRNAERVWARIVRVMAILTDKGRNDRKSSPHETRRKQDGWRGLGTALCDGGDRNWPVPGETPRPIYSEQRLARLLAAKGKNRAELTERAARMLAARKPADIGINCVDIALFLLSEDNPKHSNRIARDYYARLDRALHKTTDDTKTDSTGDDE